MTIKRRIIHLPIAPILFSTDGHRLVLCDMHDGEKDESKLVTREELNEYMAGRGTEEKDREAFRRYLMEQGYIKSERMTIYSLTEKGLEQARIRKRPIGSPFL